MLAPTGETKRRRLTEAFAQRRIAGAFIVLIVLTCAVAGGYVQQTLARLKYDHQVFDRQNMRDGYVALSDIQRVLLILQESIVDGTVTAEQRADIIAANDMIYVRATSFASASEQEELLPTTMAAVTALQAIVERTDAALATDFNNLETIWHDLIKLSREARRALALYLDEMKRFQDDLLRAQSNAVQNQRDVVWATLTGLMVFASSALLLLRKEILASNAHQTAEARIAHLAFHDSLTGLGNRMQFHEQLKTWLDQGQDATLIILDVDQFKQVNDTYGHAAGDAVLKHVATTLNQMAAEHHGFAARFGGDEFTLAIRSVNMSEMCDVCDRMLIAISEGLVFDGEKLKTNVSIGLAATSQISGDIELTVDELMRAADFALYAAKAGGRAQYTIYDEVLEAQFLERRAMIAELPGAIARGDMKVFLQPKVRIDTSETFGFEALVRWQRGDVLVQPGDFIATIEEGGYIIELDRFMLRKASQVMSDFNASHGTEFSVSVNFSALQFNSTRCFSVVKEALALSGLSPRLLTIEITETAELSDWSRAKSIITSIQKLGVRIAIDDFGAGFSSLAYLRSTFANEIKIDRSLVVDIETSDTSRFILDSVVDIARNLDLEVTVEGIETDEQRKIILQMGPVNGQGFYWSKPLPAQEALKIAMQSLSVPETRTG